MDYRKLTGMEETGMNKEMDAKSTKSGKSKKLGRSGVSRKTLKESGKGDKEVAKVGCDSDEDSRRGDFDSDDGSLGSDASKIKGLQQEIDSNQPTFMEKYNEYKVQQGHQDRLEDAELPEKIGQRDV